MGVVTLFGKVRSGRREWLFQRVANVSIVLWGAVFITLLLCMPGTDFAGLQAIFAPLWFKLYTSITLVLISANSMLAGWQIGTDYVKAATINRIFMAVCIVVSAAYAVAGLYALWLL